MSDSTHLSMYIVKTFWTLSVKKLRYDFKIFFLQPIMHPHTKKTQPSIAKSLSFMAEQIK